MVLAAITLSSKTYLDDSWDNKFFAKCGGIEPTLLTNDEVCFLELINYFMFISEEDYNNYVLKLQNYFEKMNERISSKEELRVAINEKVGFKKECLKLFLKNQKSTKPEQGLVA